MAIREWAEMTWQEVRDLDRARTVAILPIGAVEAHGPHLPLGTDVVIASAMARSGAEQLETRGIPAVVLPALFYTAAPFAAAFPGTLSTADSNVTWAVTGIARELARQGVAALALANAHLDPAHLASLDQAVSIAAEQGLLPLVFPNVAKKPWALRLTEEFQSGACHAGRYEASIVMSVRPDLVRESLRAALPANPRSLSVAIREGAHTFAEAGGPDAYFGWPADASAAEGRDTIARLGEILADAVSEALEPGGGRA